MTPCHAGPGWQRHRARGRAASRTEEKGKAKMGRTLAAQKESKWASGQGEGEKPVRAGRKRARPIGPAGLKGGIE